MAVTFIGYFKKAGNFCDYCFLSYGPLEIEKRKKSRGLAKRNLDKIIELCKDEDKKNMAKEAIKICENCNYKDPKIKNYLESHGINMA